MQSQEETRRINGPQRHLDTESRGSANEPEGGVDLVAALWRYKWAVLGPAIFGLLCGVLLWSRLPETYEASTRFLVESDQPIILDASSGDYLAGVPSSDVIRSQLFSNKVMDAALSSMKSTYLARNEEEALDRLLEVLDQEFDGSFGDFASECIEFESETEEESKSNSVAIRLSLKHTDKELVEASLIALNTSLQDYFDSKRTKASADLKVLLTEASEKHLPEVRKLEESYRKWRTEVNLQWDSNGVAINPHRIDQNRLMLRRSELDSELQAATEELAAIEATVANSKDPRTAIDVIGQLLNKELVTPIERRRAVGLKEEDFDLKRLNFQEQLVPLIVERQRAAGQYGENHPSVRDLDDQIKYSKEQFEKISREVTDRISKLLNDSDKERAEAMVAAETVVNTLRSKNKMLVNQIASTELKLVEAKKEADKLAQAEQENESWRREIERQGMLLNQLQEQMTRISLTDKGPGIELTSLTPPSSAAIVGPSIIKCVGGGTFVGLLLGCALAYVLEGQAGTFRSAQEIELALHSPIMSHVPYDPGRRRKLAKGEVDPYDKLDEKLSVVHRPSSVVAEAIRTCRTNLFFESSTSGIKVLQVTSPLPSDGKTTVAGNLAASIAQAGKRVIIIDADLRRPQLSDNFAVEEGLGLTNVLNGDCDHIDAIHATPISNLWVMPSGPIPVNPAEALTLPEMGELLQLLREQYDYVIVDTPPLLVVTDPGIVAGLVDAVMVTVKIRRKSRSNAVEALNILRSVGANILGIVINASDESSGSDGYRGYGTYKYSRYASKYNGEYGYHSERKGEYSSSGKGRRPVLLVGGKVVDVTPAEDDDMEETTAPSTKRPRLTAKKS